MHTQQINGTQRCLLILHSKSFHCIVHSQSDSSAFSHANEALCTCLRASTTFSPRADFRLESFLTSILCCAAIGSVASNCMSCSNSTSSLSCWSLVQQCSSSCPSLSSMLGMSSSLSWAMSEDPSDFRSARSTQACTTTNNKSGTSCSTVCRSLFRYTGMSRSLGSSPVQLFSHTLGRGYCGWVVSCIHKHNYT